MSSGQQRAGRTAQGQGKNEGFGIEERLCYVYKNNNRIVMARSPEQQAHRGTLDARTAAAAARVEGVGALAVGRGWRQFCQ